MTERGAIVALALIGGLLVFGVIWGLLVAAVTLLGVVLLAGLLGQLIAGDRVRASLIMPAGLAGVLLALGAVEWLRLPPLLWLAGVPILWSVAGATVAIVVAGGVSDRRRRSKAP